MSVTFFSLAADTIGRVVVSLGARSLGETLKDVKTERRMGRLVQDAVDRIVEQMDSYLRAEKLNDQHKEMIVRALCAKLQPLADDPQRFFVSDLDGVRIFEQCHPNGELPEEIREEGLGQFYSVLFPQVAHFLAGTRVALAQWQAEGFREEFKRLTHLAEQLRTMNAKVAEIPGAVMSAMTGQTGQAAETLLREFAQTVLNKVLLRLDLSPLRAERALQGSLGDHFVVPAIRERRNDKPQPLGEEDAFLNVLLAPGARGVLHGGPGIGKTTLSTWLQSRLLQANPVKLAVVLRLREVANIEQRSLLDLLHERAGVHLRDALTDEVLRTWYAHGRLAVILDGFDEVPEERRDAVERWVKDLDAVAKDTSLIITSRPLESGHLLDLPEHWRQWDVLPFDRRRIVEFIDRWHRYLPEGELSTSEREVDANKLADTFLADPSLASLAVTPLMLGTLLFVHHRDKQLPSGRVDLYERYIAAMLGLRDSGLGIEARATRLTDKEKRRVLAHVALHFHMFGVNEVNDETMTRLIKESLDKFKLDEEVTRLLPALRERTGLVQGPGAWSFTHKTIAEFLVAELICEGTTHLPDNRRLDRKELWNNRHKDAWTAVLFFWAGKTSPRELEEFVSELVDKNNTIESLLAFSLLHDQGDRLDHDVRRALALRLLKCRLPSSKSTSVAASSPMVPTFAYVEVDAATVELRGLSKRNTVVDVLTNWLSSGLLATKDMPFGKSNSRVAMTVAVLGAMATRGTRVTLDVRHNLEHLDPQTFALLSFAAISAATDTATSLQGAIVEWLSSFPTNRRLVPLLLAGMIVETADTEMSHTLVVREHFWEVLWEWRNEPVADDWLQASDDYLGWGSRHIDLLLSLRRLMETGGYDALGLNASQHKDLLAWCDRLLAERTALKTSNTEA